MATGGLYPHSVESYAATVTGITLGNGKVSGRFSESGKTVDVKFQLTLGSTTAIMGSVSFSLPVPSVTLHLSFPASVTDSAGDCYLLGAIVTAANAVTVYDYPPAGDPYVPIGPAARMALAWNAPGSVISASGRYEAA